MNFTQRDGLPNQSQSSQPNFLMGSYSLAFQETSLLTLQNYMFPQKKDNDEERRVSPNGGLDVGIPPVQVSMPQEDTIPVLGRRNTLFSFDLEEKIDQTGLEGYSPVAMMNCSPSTYYGREPEEHSSTINPSEVNRSPSPISTPTSNFWSFPPQQASLPLKKRFSDPKIDTSGLYLDNTPNPPTQSISPPQPPRRSSFASLPPTFLLSDSSPPDLPQPNKKKTVSPPPQVKPSPIVIDSVSLRPCRKLHSAFSTSFPHKLCCKPYKYLLKLAARSVDGSRLESFNLCLVRCGTLPYNTLRRKSSYDEMEKDLQFRNFGEAGVSAKLVKGGSESTRFGVFVLKVQFLEASSETKRLYKLQVHDGGKRGGFGGGKLWESGTFALFVRKTESEKRFWKKLEGLGKGKEERVSGKKRKRKVKEEEEESEEESEDERERKRRRMGQGEEVSCELEVVMRE